MKLRHRNRQDERDDYYDERPLPDEAPAPQPERSEPTLEEPTPRDLSKRDYIAIFKRAATLVESVPKVDHPSDSCLV